MRTLFLVLLLADLLVFATQFEAIRDLIQRPDTTPAPQVNAERLRIIRDPAPPPGPAS